MDKLFIFWASPEETNNYSDLKSMLAHNNWQVTSTTDSSALERFSGEKNGSTLCLVAILHSISCQLKPTELEHLNRFVAEGNHLLIASGDNEQTPNGSHLNQIAAKFGVEFNADCVIRPNPYKHYHPKEAHLEDFIVNKGFADELDKFIQSNGRVRKKNSQSGSDHRNGGAKILYPFGCTLRQLDKMSSTIMLTSSKWALPNQQAICTFHRDLSNDSRMVAFGSAALMSDPYLNEEDNRSLVTVMLEFIVSKEFPINMSDARTIEIPKPSVAPDANHLIEVPIPCLQEPEELPRDKFSLIDRRLFSLSLSIVPTISRAFEELNVERETLSLIKPNFECKPLELEPATHGFLLRRLRR